MACAASANNDGRGSSSGYGSGAHAAAGRRPESGPSGPAALAWVLVAAWRLILWRICRRPHQAPDRPLADRTLLPCQPAGPTTKKTSRDGLQALGVVAAPERVGRLTTAGGVGDVFCASESVVQDQKRKAGSPAVSPALPPASSPRQWDRHQSRGVRRHRPLILPRHSFITIQHESSSPPSESVGPAPVDRVCRCVPGWDIAAAAVQGCGSDGEQRTFVWVAN